MIEALRLVILFSITGFATYYDGKERKIPNALVLVGSVLGLSLSASFNEVLFKIASLLFLFFLGMFHLMGMGDLKLWMAIACITGFTASVVIIGIAAAALIIFAFKKDMSGSKRILSIAAKDLAINRKIEVFEQPSYAFAPMIFLASVGYILFETGGILF